MRKFLFAAAMTAASVAGGADAEAQAWEGEVALSFGRAPFLNTDDDDERLSESAYSLSGWAGARFGDWRIFGDANLYRRDIGAQNYRDYAPEGARSLGLHAGRSFGPVYVGAFVGRNWFQGESADTTGGYVSGDLYGLEGQFETGPLTLFGQIGRADMVGDPGDTAFDGRFARIGASVAVDRIGMTFDYETGRSSDIFEDDGDAGEYTAAGFALDYAVTERVIATVGYTRMDITANTEDSGYDEFYSVGVRIPLGSNDGRRNLLTTTYRPGLAAAWAETLD